MRAIPGWFRPLQMSTLVHPHEAKRDSLNVPETPEDETLRLAKLRSLRLLDPGADVRFDRLTRMARRIFKVPISMINLMDENRQWFQACDGQMASDAVNGVAFYGHTINSSDVFIIEDAREDERFIDHSLVVHDPHIRFYAGCPLFLDHHKLGILCIADQSPRSLDQEQIETLKDLASLVVQELAATLLATKDELTGLDNRRGFLSLAQQSLQLCTRQGLPVSLLSLDLGDFKLNRGTQEPQAWNQNLITFAELLQHVCRDSDVVARLGGDEFVVLLMNSTREQSENVILRIKKALRQENNLAGHQHDIDFCYGITAYQPERHETIAELLADGDTLMHEIKRLRRLEL